MTLEPLLARAVATDFAPLMAETQRLASQVGKALGELDRSRELLLQALESGARAQDHALVARAWRELVFLVGHDEARHGESASLALAARIALEQAGGGDYERALLASAVGSTAQSAEDHQEALRLGEEALAIFERVRGPAHPETIRQLANNANALAKLGRRADAEAAFRRALDAMIDAQGAQHPDVARIRINLGSVLREQQQYPQAREQYQLALASLERSGRREAVASLLSNMASLDRSTGEPARARARYEQALALRRDMLGEEHPAVADLHFNLGNLARDERDWTRAEARYQRALEIRETSFGRRHASVARVLAALAKLDAERGQPRAALARYREAVEIADETGAEPLWLALTRMELALLLSEHAPGARTEMIELARRARAELERLDKPSLVAACDQFLELVGGTSP